MKKYLSLLIVLTITLFIGAGIAKAVDAKNVLDFSNAELSYGTRKTITDSANNTKVTSVTVFGNPKETAEVTGTQHWVVKLTKSKADDSSLTHFVEKVNDSANGKITNLKQTDTGAEFDYTYNGTTATQGQAYELFTLSITQGPADKYADNECGGTISPTASGTNTVTPSGDPVGPSETGFSIPVAIIGFGSLAGLSIYASTSRKTKMHRI